MKYAVLALTLSIAIASSAPAQGWADKMFKGNLSHDFGTVPRGAQLTHNFTITNIYAVRMEITNIKSGCGCVSATAAKRVLEPRESTTIEVRMDGRRFTGAKTVGVRVTVGPNFISSSELRISANSRADIVFNPGEVNFGTVTKGQTTTQTVDVEYAGALAFQISEVIAKDIPFTVSIQEMYRRPGQVGYRLSVALKADAPLGVLKHNIFLKTNDPASPMVSVLVEANIQSALTVTPPLLTVGMTKIDSPLIRRVVVRGKQPFHVTSIEGLGDGVELGATLSVKDEMVQFVTFKVQPSKEGVFRRELKIKTTAQDSPAVVIIEGSGVK